MSEPTIAAQNPGLATETATPSPTSSVLSSPGITPTPAVLGAVALPQTGDRPAALPTSGGAQGEAVALSSIWVITLGAISVTAGTATLAYLSRSRRRRL